MKNYKLTYLVLIVIAMFINSCSDSFIDESPNDSVTVDQAITNEEQLQEAVYGLYSLFRNGGSFGAAHFTYQEIGGDHAFVSADNSNRFTVYDLWTFSSESGFGGIWSSAYRIIGECNFILATEGQIMDDANVTGTPVNFYAQVKALKAYVYSVLLMYYSPPYGVGDQSLGIPLPNTFSEDYTAVVGRSTLQESYAEVINLLSSSIPHLEDGDSYVFGKTAGEVLLSRVYLYMKDYPNAILHANNALSSSSHSLLTMANVPAFFYLESDPERVFQVQMTSNFNPGSNDAFTATWTTTGTYKQNFATRAFWSTIPSSDIRKSAWFQDNAFVQSTSDLIKPIDVTKYFSLDSDMIQLRLTEAVLNKIEAEYYVNPATALTDLNNWVSQYRDPAFSSSNSGAALLNDILQQRSIELFAEGHRMYDLKRNGLGVNKPQTSALTPLNIPANDYRFIAPIPKREIDTNNLITQAPGYSN